MTKYDYIAIGSVAAIGYLIWRANKEEIIGLFKKAGEITYGTVKAAASTASPTAAISYSKAAESLEIYKRMLELEKQDWVKTESVYGPEEVPYWYGK